MTFDTAAQNSLSRAYIAALDAGSDSAQLFQKIVRTLVGDAGFDAIGERARMLRRPEIDEGIGGVFSEIFVGRHQKFHSHVSGDHHESDRFLLLMPIGAKGQAYIIPDEGQGECIEMEEGIIHAFHFEGANQHGFMTSDDHSQIYCVAIHPYDLYDSMDALERQTEFKNLPVRAKEIPAIKDAPLDSAGLIQEYLGRIMKALQAEDKTGFAGRKFAEILLHVAKIGKGSGSREFQNFDSLQAWLERACRRDTGAYPYPP